MKKQVHMEKCEKTGQTGVERHRITHEILRDSKSTQWDIKIQKVTENTSRHK